METSIVGVGVGITDRFRTVVEDKAARIEHLAPRAQRVDIKVTHRAYHNGRMEDDTVELTLTGDRMTEATGALCRIPNIPGALTPEEDPNIKVEVLAAEAERSAEAEHRASHQAGTSPVKKRRGPADNMDPDIDL